MDGRGLIVSAAVATLTSCGGDSGFEPAAEPAVAPVVVAAPAGEVKRIVGEVEGLELDERTGILAAVARDPGLLSLIDARTLETLRTVPVGRGARHLGLSGPGGPVLVPAQFADKLQIVELPSGAVETVRVGESPHDAAAVGARVFVGDEGGDTVTVIEDEAVIETLVAPVQPGAVESVGATVAVVAVAERVLTVFDARTLEQVGEVPAGIGPTHAVSLGERLFVADTQGDAVIEFRVSPGRQQPVEVGRVAVEGAPYGLAVDARRQRLWVTSTARNLLVEMALDAGGLEEVGSYPTVRQPNTVAVDERTGAVFVASRTDGEIQRIEPAR